jgi:Iap family predicted aminopeptidase
MEELGFQNVRLEPVKVPHWVRGRRESASMTSGPGSERLAVCALGNSMGTPKGGVEAEVVEVHSLSEAEALGETGRGKIVFYNRPMDPAQARTFAAYGEAVDQRSRGAISAAKSGAVAVLVRSMTMADDDFPHTGFMGYEESVKKIPSGALGIRSANRLSERLKSDPRLRVRLEMDCKSLPEEMSSNVVGEIRGAEKPDEVVLMGGHLDSWDLGQGAHDDGAGCVQSLEALRLLTESGFRPKRTIRVVLFMDEENGGGGAQAYAAAHKNERHVAAIESDDGGFMPRAFTCSAEGEALERIKRWLPLLAAAGIERVSPGGGGADIEPLAAQDTVLFGLEPDNQRYFDYHHSAADTLDKVHPRELELGAAAMAILARLLSEDLK